jgi:ubiquinone/menaquinone biosynthesis C-methylase UbiE
MTIENAHHTQYGLNSTNFKQLARQGFGDLLNGYAHSMAWFHDYLYVGTTRANLVLLHEGNKAVSGLIGETFWPVKVPKDIWELDLGSQIWRYNPKTNGWCKIFSAPRVKGLNEKDVPISVSFRVMTVFQGESDPSPALYVPTWATSQWPQTVMLRSIDGIKFEMVSEPGLGLSDPKPRALRALVPFKGRLFTAPAMGQERGSPNAAGRMVVLTSSDPYRGQWQLACEPHFGDCNNLSVFHMAPFKDFLYAGTLNTAEGYQVWKTDAEGEPPYQWTKVVSHGAYRGKLNQMAMSLCAFGDYLYVGSAIQTGGIDRRNNVGPAAPELIRIREDDSWELVVGETRITPQGFKIPLSGFGPGFDKNFVGYFWQMCVHDGWLYLSDAVWSTFFLFSDYWTKTRNKGKIVDHKTYESYLRKFGGFHLWRTRDGSRWLPVTKNGFGNYYNIGARTMLSTKYGLFVGVANSFGPEVAQKRLAGWTYELNPKGGLEIWLGSRNSNLKALHDCRANDTIHDSDQQRIDIIHTNNTKTKDVVTVISHFYGDSEFNHLGYWEDDTTDAKAACHNLMDEILAFIEKDDGNVLDLCCDKGMTTQYLLDRFNADAIVGLTTDRNNLEFCNRNASRVKFLVLKGSTLPFPKDSFDYVLCAKGLEFFKSFEKIIKEVYRILRPGGRFVFIDIIYDDRLIKRRKLGFFKSNIDVPMNPEGYRRLLMHMGFRNVRVMDSTFNCWTQFRKYSDKYFAKKLLAKEIDEDTLRNVKNNLQGYRDTLNFCVFCSADKINGE